MATELTPWQLGYIAGAEHMKAFVLSKSKSFRHQDHWDGLVIQIEGFIEPRDVRNIGIMAPLPPPLLERSDPNSTAGKP